MQTGYICTCKNHKFKMAICCTCKSDKNVYNSKCCKQRISSWTPEPHAFCLYCLLRYSLKYNYYISGWEYHAKIACPGCKSAIFEIVHCASGVVRSMDELLKELFVFEFCERLPSLKRVMEHIMQQLKQQHGAWDDWRRNFTYIEKLVLTKRRFELRPETFKEYSTLVDYEMEWYDWKPHVKCGQCSTVLNLYQCVDKSECKHIFCLACLIETMDSDVIKYVRCPICYSYCAGTAEHYHTKAVLPIKFIKVFHWATELTDSIDETIENFDMYDDEWDNDELQKIARQSRERLITQPECYEAMKKLRKLELPMYAYKEE